MSVFDSLKLRMSLPMGRIVHGVKIEKAPIGRYLDALAALEELPRKVVDSCFPGMSTSDVIASFASADSETAWATIMRAIAVLPRPVLESLCEITGMDAGAIDRLTPAEFAEILKAFWEVNRLSDFFTAAAGLGNEIKTLAMPRSNA